MARPLSQSAAVRKTIDALKAEGRIGEVDQAVVAMAQGLAAAVDAEPENAALWREFRQTLVALAAAGSDNIDDDARDFILSIRTPQLRAPLRDAEDT